MYWPSTNSFTTSKVYLQTEVWYPISRILVILVDNIYLIKPFFLSPCLYQQTFDSTKGKIPLGMPNDGDVLNVSKLLHIFTKYCAEHFLEQSWKCLKVGDRFISKFARYHRVWRGLFFTLTKLLVLLNAILPSLIIFRKIEFTAGRRLIPCSWLILYSLPYEEYDRLPEGMVFSSHSM